jgi:hypothetical protein
MSIELNMDNKHIGTIYITAFACGVIGLLLARYSFKLCVGCCLLAALLYVIGFLLHYRAVIKAIWRRWWRWFTAGVFAALHLICYFVSSVCAKGLVADSIGLPVKDFDATVHIFSAVYYLPMAVLLTAFMLYLCIFPAMGKALWHAVIVHEIERLWMFLSPVMPHIVPIFNETKKKNEQKDLVAIGDVAGIVFLSFGLFFVWQTTDGQLKRLDHLVRIVAYNYDFLPAEHYPGVGKSERVVFHDEGLISVATPNGSDITFTTRKAP